MSERSSSLEEIRSYIDNKLKLIDLPEFLIMIWAIDRVQSGGSPIVIDGLYLPDAAVTHDPGSPYFAHKWELESLVNRALRKCSDTTLILPTSSRRRFGYTDFINLYNAGLKLENAEYGEIRFHTDVLDEMHRLSQRQFEWQRGFSSIAQMYRYAYLFDGRLCREHILSKFGYSLSDLSLFCFGIKGLAQAAPALPKNVDLQQVFLTSDIKRAIVERLCAQASHARSQADLEHGFAYSKSVIRARPLVQCRGISTLYVPLRELVMARSTVNCFYDFYGMHSNARREIGERFELYAFNIMKSSLTSCDVKRSFKYDFRGDRVESPDVLMNYSDRFPDIVFECKSTQMSFDAKFSLDPIKDARRGHDQMARGVCQIWTYVSRRRCLKLKAPSSEFGTIGVVLTLDSWLTMSNKREDIMSIAYEMAANDGDIDRHDNIPILFCSIEELELVLSLSTEEEFLTTIFLGATDRRFHGWLLSSIYSRLFGDARKPKPYPFEKEIGNVLAWWKQLETIRNHSD